MCLIIVGRNAPLRTAFSVDLNPADFFQWAQYPGTGGRRFKLYKRVLEFVLDRRNYFSERVVNVWNNLPDNADFTVLNIVQPSMFILLSSEHILNSY